MPRLFRLRFSVLLVLVLLGRSLPARGADHVIVVDTSASMQEAVNRTDRRIRLQVVQQELTRHLKSLPTGSRVHLIAFNSGIRSEKQYLLTSAKERQLALDWVGGLGRLRPGDTYLWSALRTGLRVAMNFLAERPPQPVSVLVLTDGRDNEPNGPSLADLLREFPLKLRQDDVRTGLILLGDLDVDSLGPVTELGLEVILNRDWQLIFPPVIQWSPKLVKVGEPVTFSIQDTTTYADYRWQLAGQCIGQQARLTHEFAKAGPQTLSLAVTDAAGHGARASVEVNVKPADLACAFTMSAHTVEVGQPVRLLSQSRGEPTSQAWQINGQEVGTEPDHTFLPSAVGTYEIGLTVRRDADRASAVPANLRVIEPVVDLRFLAVTQAASGQPIVFTNTTLGPVAGFLWQFGDGATSTNWHAIHAFRNPGPAAREFTVLLQARSLTGKTLASTPWRVQVLPPAPPPKRPLPPPPPAPQAAFRVVSPPPYQVGSPIEVVDASTGPVVSYAWSLGAEQLATNRTATLEPTQPGTNILRLVVSGPGGQATAEQLLEVLPRAVPPRIIAVLADPPKLRLKRKQNVTVSFEANIQGEYQVLEWDFGDGGRSGLLKTAHQYASPSNYLVRVTARNADHQEATATVSVRVLPPRPLWHLIPVALAIGLVAWVGLVVPCVLKPARLPHRTALLRSSATHHLRQLANRGRWRWLWPSNTITIGTLPTNHLHLVIPGRAEGTLARIKRKFGSQIYRLIPEQDDAVKLLEKYLVPLPAHTPHVLRDGDQLCLGEETFSWSCLGRAADNSLACLVQDAQTEAAGSTDTVATKIATTLRKAGQAAQTRLHLRTSSAE